MNNLEYYRLKAGLSQTELAEKSGIFQTQISRAEKGVLDFKGNQWKRLAEVLDCTVDELVGLNHSEKE